MCKDNISVRLENGNIIDDTNIRQAVIDMQHNDFDTATYQDKLITKVGHSKNDDVCIVVVRIS